MLDQNGNDDDTKIAKVFGKLMALLSVRDRSVHEARCRLQKSAYQQSVIDEVLQRAISSGLLDDQRFAADYINSKLRSGWGSLRIEQELKRFGIDCARLPDYPDAYFDERRQINRAIAALSRHRSHARNQYQAKYRYLAQKGYPPDIVAAALQDDGLADTPS
ncbi:MAG: recombination regulator RecX [Coriobacteriales bacterium]|jgi:regulatory protein|nr:recombination regulator RecX [Coriobacteriales bacterium]